MAAISKAGQIYRGFLETLAKNRPFYKAKDLFKEAEPIKESMRAMKPEAFKRVRTITATPSLDQRGIMGETAGEYIALNPARSRNYGIDEETFFHEMGHSLAATDPTHPLRGVYKQSLSEFEKKPQSHQEKIKRLTEIDADRFMTDAMVRKGGGEKNPKNHMMKWLKMLAIGTTGAAGALAVPEESEAGIATKVKALLGKPIGRREVLKEGLDEGLRQVGLKGDRLATKAKVDKKYNLKSHESEEETYLSHYTEYFGGKERRYLDSDHGPLYDMHMDYPDFARELEVSVPPSLHPGEKLSRKIYAMAERGYIDEANELLMLTAFKKYPPGKHSLIKSSVLNTTKDYREEAVKDLNVGLGYLGVDWDTAGRLVFPKERYKQLSKLGQDLLPEVFEVAGKVGGKIGEEIGKQNLSRRQFLGLGSKKSLAAGLAGGTAMAGISDWFSPNEAEAMPRGVIQGVTKKALQGEISSATKQLVGKVIGGKTVKEIRKGDGNWRAIIFDDDTMSTVTKTEINDLCRATGTTESLAEAVLPDVSMTEKAINSAEHHYLRRGSDHVTKGTKELYQQRHMERLKEMGLDRPKQSLVKYKGRIFTMPSEYANHLQEQGALEVIKEIKELK